MTKHHRKRVLFIFGTRPEAIKLAPVINEMRARPREFYVEVCVTAQHREMLDQILPVFGIVPEYDLDVMRPDQSLAALTARILIAVEGVLCRVSPDIVVVQGDTTTTVSGAIAAFYKKIAVAHVEAGLRTANPLSPFPEEMNRRLTGCASRWHFAPTERAREALRAENYDMNSVFVTGNTAVDALMISIKKVRSLYNLYASRFPFLSRGRMVLITCHRRESFGQGMNDICMAIRSLALSHQDISFVYPVHLNPNVQEPVHRYLGNIRNIFLLQPQPYLEFLWLMDRAEVILTDSGGVQEEAPSLGKPVVVMRDRTERTEGVTAGVAVIAGTSQDGIASAVNDILGGDRPHKQAMPAENPFGDGRAAGRIADVLSAT